jgi:hypothetical protein
MRKGLGKLLQGQLTHSSTKFVTIMKQNFTGTGLFPTNFEDGINISMNHLLMTGNLMVISLSPLYRGKNGEQS